MCRQNLRVATSRASAQMPVVTADMQKIVELLHESGSAIKCLAPGNPDNIPTRKEQFDEHAQNFARLLEAHLPSSPEMLINVGGYYDTSKEHTGPFQGCKFCRWRTFLSYAKFARQGRRHLGQNSGDSAKFVMYGEHRS
jgi:hypothetical protein